MTLQSHNVIYLSELFVRWLWDCACSYDWLQVQEHSQLDARSLYTSALQMPAFATCVFLRCIIKVETQQITAKREGACLPYVAWS